MSSTRMRQVCSSMQSSINSCGRGSPQTDRCVIATRTRALAAIALA